MPKKQKKSHKYFIITSFLVLVTVFFIIYFWKAYIWQISINRVFSNIQFKPNSSYASISKPTDKNLLITPAKEVYQTMIEKTDPMIGKIEETKNKLLIIEFGDLTDKMTWKVKSDVDRIMLKLKNKIIFVWKDFPQPLNKESKNAALAARCAQDQESFWEYIDWLRQQDNFNQDVYNSLANRLELDLIKFSLCYEKKEKIDLIGKNMKQAQNYWVESIPHLFVGGRSIKIDDNYNYEKLERIAREELINNN